VARGCQRYTLSCHSTSAIEGGSSGTIDTKFLLDADGESLGAIVQEIVGDIAVAVGPEGGLEEHERNAFITHGWRPVSLGRNILRFETAGIAALAVLRALSPTGQ
jgi:RNA methyltransferase, RsmE family